MFSIYPVKKFFKTKTPRNFIRGVNFFQKNQATGTPPNKGM